MLKQRLRRLLTAAAIAAAALLAAGCGGGDEPTLYIGGIPDQDVSVLEARFKLLAEYLSDETGADVRYLPSHSYAALVTGWRNDEVQFAWYGGLTGVQARLAVPGSDAVAQRVTDENFTSVFVAAPDSGISGFDDLRGRTFTFGSESSTSGHLMPRYFLSEAGIAPEQDFAGVAYSGSHDATWKQVEAGAVEAGALNANVWNTRVGDGDVDRSKVERLLHHAGATSTTTGSSGPASTTSMATALPSASSMPSSSSMPGTAGADREIMDAFQAERFIPTTNENYRPIETIARGLGLIEEQ